MKKRSKILSDYLFAKIEYEIYKNPDNNNYFILDLENILTFDTIEIIEDVFYSVFINGFTKYETEHNHVNPFGLVPAFFQIHLNNIIQCYFYDFESCSCHTKVISKEEFDEYNMKIRLKKLQAI
ncbi:hypothetical protein M0Q50_10120, partial [bacterium]|jgi:hypothetical protein|nr:hypothetical protein [bacterium]